MLNNLNMDISNNKHHKCDSIVLAELIEGFKYKIAT